MAGGCKMRRVEVRIVMRFGHPCWLRECILAFEREKRRWIALIADFLLGLGQNACMLCTVLQASIGI